MENKTTDIVLPPYFSAWRFMPAILLIAIAVRFSVAGQYNAMGIAVAGALFGPAQWVWQRDKLKSIEGYELNVAKANRWLIFAICLTGAALAWINNSVIIAAATLVAGFGQFWFQIKPTSSQRLGHGLSATILTFIGYILYRPMMYICLPLSIIFAWDYLRIQRLEKEELKKLQGKKKKKKRKK